MPHITLIGTSHIAEKSVQDIKKAYADTQPDISAVELDRQRLDGLLSEQKRSYSPRLIGKIGLAGYLFALIGGLMQRKLGKAVGMNPGADMLAAVRLAQEHNKPLLLIDRKIQVTLKRLSKKLTRKEKWQLLTDILFGWAKKQPKVAIDLKSVPQDKLITTLLEQLKGRYPTFYEVLVHERNLFMAHRLVRAAAQHQDKHILAIVGAGHKEGMMQAFEEHQTKQQHS